eukprot:m51a1_g9315 hypothetical protein (682) ;mRNA; r:116647-118875
MGDAAAAAPAEAAEELPIDLCCPICFEVFTDPSTLPCGHTFCIGCLQLLHNRLCPQCRAAIPEYHVYHRNIALCNAIQKIKSLPQEFEALRKAAAEHRDAAQREREEREAAEHRAQEEREAARRDLETLGAALETERRALQEQIAQRELDEKEAARRLEQALRGTAEAEEGRRKLEEQLHSMREASLSDYRKQRELEEKLQETARRVCEAAEREEHSAAAATAKQQQQQQRDLERQLQQQFCCTPSCGPARPATGGSRAVAHKALGECEEVRWEGRQGSPMAAAITGVASGIATSVASLSSSLMQPLFSSIMPAAPAAPALCGAPTIDEYTLLERMGLQLGCAVFKAVRRDDPNAPPVALKELVPRTTPEAAMREALVLATLSEPGVMHPSVVRLNRVVRASSASSPAAEAAKRRLHRKAMAYLEMPFACDADLDFLLRSRMMSPGDSRVVAAQLLCALAHLHANGVVHRYPEPPIAPLRLSAEACRDVRPTSVLCASWRPYPRYVLASFGSACGVPEAHERSLWPSRSASSRYAAPEVSACLQQGQPDGVNWRLADAVDWRLADSWSAGAVVAEVLLGFCPSKRRELPSGGAPEGFEDIAGLVARLVCLDAAGRASAAEALGDACLARGLEPEVAAEVAATARSAGDAAVRGASGRGFDDYAVRFFVQSSLPDLFAKFFA